MLLTQALINKELCAVSNKATKLLTFQKITMNTYPNNTDELRQIPIVSYLEHQGYRPAKPENSRGEVKFLSPFRSETKPSFSVNVGKNVWHDYGTGEGGSIFDLVMKLWNVDFIKAKEILGKGTYKQMFYRPSDTHYERQRPSPFTDIRASPLTSTYFLDYCKERCIDLDVAKEECHQVDYRLSGHMNSAIGFENDKGGGGSSEVRQRRSARVRRSLHDASRMVTRPFVSSRASSTICRS